MVLNLRTCHASWIVTQCVCPGQWGRALCDNRMKKKRDNRHNNKCEGNLMYCSYEIDSSSHGVNVLRKDTLVGPLRATLLRVAVCILCVCQWRRAFNNKLRKIMRDNPLNDCARDCIAQMLQDRLFISSWC